MKKMTAFGAVIAFIMALPAVAQVTDEVPTSPAAQTAATQDPGDAGDLPFGEGVDAAAAAAPTG